MQLQFYWKRLDSHISFTLRFWHLAFGPIFVAAIWKMSIVEMVYFTGALRWRQLLKSAIAAMYNYRSSPYLVE